MMSCPTRRISQRVQPWELDCFLHDGTRGTRWTRTPGTSITKTMRSCICATRDVIDVGGTQRFSQRAGTVGERLSHPQPARENLYDRTTGTSVTVFSNW